MPISIFCKRTFALLLLMFLVACVGSSTPAKFYLLEPLSKDVVESGAIGDKSVLALVPVRIPHYLERVQLVTSSGKNTYDFDELHRWAESLDDNMSRVILQNLSVLLSADVVMSTSQRAEKAKAQLAVTILDFYIDPLGQAKLTATWQIRRGDKETLSGQSTHFVAVDGNDVQMKVDALNQCLNKFSQEMANILKPLVITYN